MENQKKPVGLDMKRLREASATIKNRAEGGNLYFQSKQIKEETDIRILTPTPAMNGSYYVEQEGWWVNGKFYQVNSTRGGEDVIRQEIEEARASGDPDVLALLDAKKDKMPLVKNEFRYLIPILLLSVRYNDADEIESINVVDDTGKILVAKPTVLSGIHAIVTNRQFQNGTPYGICDREKGWNIVLSKTGEGLNTKYSAIGWTAPTEMDEKYYSGERYPDVVKEVEKSAHSDEFLRAVIRNYLYGEPMPASDAKPAASEGKDVTNAAPVAEKKPASSGRPRVAKAEAAPAKVERGSARAGRSLLEDAADQLSDMD